MTNDNYFFATFLNFIYLPVLFSSKWNWTCCQPVYIWLDQLFFYMSNTTLVLGRKSVGKCFASCLVDSMGSCLREMQSLSAWVFRERVAPGKKRERKRKEKQSKIKKELKFESSHKQRSLPRRTRARRRRERRIEASLLSFVLKLMSRKSCRRKDRGRSVTDTTDPSHDTHMTERQSKSTDDGL